MLDYENQFNPFVERKETITLWKKYAIVEIEETEGLIKQARNLLELGIKSKDVLHIASAIITHADYFLSTVKDLLKKSANLNNTNCLNPVNFIDILEELENE